MVTLPCGTIQMIADIEPCFKLGDVVTWPAMNTDYLITDWQYNSIETQIEYKVTPLRHPENHPTALFEHVLRTSTFNNIVSRLSMI